jgi:hypothetical protein
VPVVKTKQAIHPDLGHPDLSTIVGVIAKSQIVVCGRSNREIVSRLPAGFDLVDVGILDWIVSFGGDSIMPLLG